MKDIGSKQRRKLLLLGGALAAQACLPMRAARALTLPPPPPLLDLLKDLLKRYTASIIPVRSNPYFVPQGGSLAVPRPAGAPFSGTGLPGSASQVSTLVLYDTTGPWGWLGEIYAAMAGNLASHFGAWVAMPVVSYTAGTLQQYSACIYIGSTYGEPLPAAFLTDVYAATTNVIWIYDNIWQLTASQPQFAARYGFMPWVFVTSSVATVTYKAQSVRRYSANAAGIMSYSSIGAPATVLAECVRADSTTFPWAVRSGNLTYIGEIPFAYMTEGARYLDPNGYYNDGVPQDVPLHTQPLMIAAIRTMQLLGGVMMHHGYTHQYSNIANPYTAVTGDDCEFYRITASNGVLTYVGPLPEDTDSSWAQGRFDSYAAELSASTFTMPQISTFPAYSASVPDYQAAAQTFAARAERTLYFPGVLTNQTIDYTRPAGQYVPYSVQDAYGSKVLPDTLGGIDPDVFFNIPPRLPADIIADAQRTLVVRDGVASFFYNPEDPLSYLQQTVQGLLDLGYQFVSPLDV